MGSIFGSFFDAGSPTVTRRVKNPTLQGGLNSLFSDYNALKGAGKQTLDQYISDYLKQNKQAESNTAQESAALDQFYNGGMEQRLSALRAQRAAAGNAAADTAVSEALRGIKSSAVGGQGTGSSYEDRLAMGAVLPIRTNIALQNSDLARGDLNYLTTNQLGLMGQRNAMGDALAGRDLVPYQVRSGMYSQNAANMGPLLNYDALNHFYGLHQNPSGMAQLTGDINSMSGLVNAGSGLVSSVGKFGGQFAGIPGMGSGLGGMLSAGPGLGSAASSAVGLTGGFRYGGLVGHDYAGGGMVRGPGGYTSDSVPAHLSRDEFVIPAAAVHIPGVLPILQRIRQMGLALTPGLGVHPGHLASGGFYADSFGGLTRADQGQQALDLQQQAMTDRSMSDDEARDIQQRQFNATLEEARRRDANQALYQTGQLDLSRDYLRQQQQNNPAQIKDRELMDKYVLEEAENGNDMSDRASSDTVKQIAKQRASQVGDQQAAVYDHAKNISEILNKKALIDQQIPLLTKQKQDATHFYGNSADFSQIDQQLQNLTAQQTELNKALQSIDPKHVQGLVTYDPTRKAYVPSVPVPKKRSALAGQSAGTQQPGRNPTITQDSYSEGLAPLGQKLGDVPPPSLPTDGTGNNTARANALAGTSTGSTGGAGSTMVIRVRTSDGAIWRTTPQGVAKILAKDPGASVLQPMGVQSMGDVRTSAFPVGFPGR